LQEAATMPSSYTLGKHFEAFVKAQVASGRYNNASEVLRDGLRLLEERERKLAALDAAIARSLADVEAGRVTDADEVFDRLEAKYAAMASQRKAS
jgi:antitoxin ParD1/3/4